MIYLDPPFNSKQTYNVLFKDDVGKYSSAQIAVFDDTWHWNEAAEETYYELITGAPEAVSSVIGALRTSLGTSQMMAYLAMMGVRLLEMYRVLRETGSIYLHCDPTASHYLKIILDAVFEPQNFINEIIWRRTTTKNDYRQGARIWPRVHDVILHYAKDYNKLAVFNQPFSEYSVEYVDKFYKYIDGNGRRYTLSDLTAPGAGSRGHPRYEFMGVTRYWRYNKRKMEKLLAEGRIIQRKAGSVPRYKRYLDEMPGVAIGDVWDDIRPIGARAAERLGYPTQKPLVLLERIIKASSNRGDIVLDPFCGCGTTIAAAEKLDRKWIGIDITHLAISLQKYRLQESFPEAEFEVIGEPQSVEAAKYLAEQDRYQFEWWALSLVRARPGKAVGRSKRGKKGADRGIDGVIPFIDGAKRKAQRALVQVKSGKVSSRDIRDLVGTVEREKGAIGVLITLQPPTRAMKTEAVTAGFYESPLWGKKYPKIQILTIEELFGGKRVEMPPAWETFKRARRVGKKAAVQEKLL